MGRAAPCEPCRAVQDAGAKIKVDITVNWGDEKGGATWDGKRAFCSFKCLAEWVAEKAEDHEAVRYPY